MRLAPHGCVVPHRAAPPTSMKLEEHGAKTKNERKRLHQKAKRNNILDFLTRVRRLSLVLGSQTTDARDLRSSVSVCVLCLCACMSVSRWYLSDVGYVARTSTCYQHVHTTGDFMRMAAGGFSMNEFVVVSEIDLPTTESTYTCGPQVFLTSETHRRV